jgi:hypothetical protein
MEPGLEPVPVVMMGTSVEFLNFFKKNSLNAMQEEQKKRYRM